MAETPSHFRPLRWLAHLPLAILPFLAAAAIEGPRLRPQLERALGDRLAAAGQGWATPLVSGRDVEIRGLAPDRVAMDRAREVASATFGVRRVDMHAGVALP